MSPNELLKEVVGRFDLLLIEDEDALLESLLRKTLVTYQDKAGYVRLKKYTEDEGDIIPYPDDYLQLVSIEDGDGEILLIDLMPDGIYLNFSPPSRFVKSKRYPITMSYLINFRKADLDKFQIPETAIGLMSKYLECLITIKNVPRLHRVSVSSKVDISYIPDEATLEMRKSEIEAEMTEQKAIIKGASIFY